MDAKSEQDRNEKNEQQEAGRRKDKNGSGGSNKSSEDAANSQQANDADASARPTCIRDQGPRPRRPRPLRPNHFRMVALAAGAGQHRGERAPIIETSAPQTLVGVPIEAQIELASGVLQPAGRATMVPPKRPNYPPVARHFAAADGTQQPYALHHHHHHRFQPTTSLGATALTPNSGSKPNRYSWAQMQQWHAAAAAAAAAAGGTDATGVVEGGGGGAGPAGGGTAAGGFHYHLPMPFSSAASRVLVVPNPIVNLSEHTKSRLVKFIEAIKRFSEKWFSHVLLLLFLASYACFGAYIFISFEAPNEQWEKQLIIDTRLRIVNESYDQVHELGSRELYVDAFRVKFEEYERLLNRACASGMASNSLDNQWTFWNALFYSMTVFTTIGYGHLTPVTFAGRVATMIYAIFGIPILLMVLADLGKLLTRIIKYAFKKFRYMYNKLLGKKASVRTRQLITDNTNQYIDQARHAFERGFSTYIQPYQSRLPNAFLREFRASKTGAGGLEEHADSVHQQLESHHEPESRQTRLESSDVIVTPGKQTKPVSPKIDGDKAKDQQPRLVADQEHHQDKQQQQQPHQQQPQASSKQKDKSKRSRKISASQKQVAAADSAAKERRSSQKHSVTRSSSATNVVDATGSTKSTLATTKRSSLDQQVAGAGQEESSADATSGQGEEKLQGAAATGLDCDSEGQHNLEHHQKDNDLETLDQQHDDEFVDELDEDLDIPVSFALFLLITYMMFGAVVFSIWESWNFFDSLYFVFISMSTIGFGDLVPQHPKRMIGTFAYLLFGLALTSMCINVVQEKIHATFLRAKMQIGEKMGFDLDQIMADDYYHDGGSAFGDDSEEQLDENGSYANSVALSQANSTSEHGGQPATGAAELQTGSQHGATAHQTGVGGEPVPASAAAISRSKSKESLKWKKRSLSGASIGGGHGSSSDQHSIGSSCKRKISAGSKKAVSAAAQARQQQQLQLQHQQQQQAAGVKENKPATPAASPIKHQIEIIRMLNVPVMLQQLEERPAASGQSKPRANLANPSINQPIDGGIRAFCEPLRRAFQAGQRPKLVATRSQPSSPYHLNGSHPHVQLISGGTSGAASPSGGQQHQSGRARLAEMKARRNGRVADTMTRSLAGSRRASVSDELNQLDDLIVALSKSPPERYGPLLGIPSTRSSRSNSPANRYVATVTSTPSSAGSTPRRGASLMVRGSSDSMGARKPLGRLAQERQCSFASTTQTPPFMTPSGSSNLLANNDQQPSSYRAAANGSRKSSSSSSGAMRYAMASAQQSSNELNLSESQAALAELEAVRFSAV